MIGFILIILTVLWFLGYIHLSFIHIPDIVLFTLNNQHITLYNILILAVIAWAIGVLPTPFRQIASVILILWVLSTLGFLYIAGLSSLLILALIVGIIFFLLEG